MSTKKQRPIALAKTFRPTTRKPSNTSTSKSESTDIPRGIPKRERSKDRLGKLNRTYALLNAINQTIVREPDKGSTFTVYLPVPKGIE